MSNFRASPFFVVTEVFGFVCSYICISGEFLNFKTFEARFCNPSIQEAGVGMIVTL